LHWQAELPELRAPVLLIALEGFVDAGEAGSTAATFLRHRWRSELVATFDRDALLDYRARRPTAVVDAGELRRLEWPDVSLYAAEVDGPRDALFLVGPEPDMAWGGFTEAVEAAIHQAGVASVIGMGAYPAATPHTRPIRIVRVANSGGAELVTDADNVGGYTGPVGAAITLQAALGEGGLPAVGLWAEVPHYISGSPNPRAGLALVRTVTEALETSVDTTELQAAAETHDEQVQEAVDQHPEAKEMIQGLEEQVDSGGEGEELLSGEDLAAEIERYLKSEE
jgi:predicted ATP-grasp superfamily ATP-dependent carboligase